MDRYRAPASPGWGDRFRAALTAPESSWFVAEVGGLVVGGIFVQDTHGVAHLGMAVLESNRGAGLGRSLLNAAVGWARDRGCYKVTLEVWPHNTRAIGLYEKLGFVIEARYRRHWRRRDGSLWDALAMGLVLDEDAPGGPPSAPGDAG